MKFIGNISDATWAVADDASIVEFAIGFVSNDADVVVFDNLSFGYTASCGEKVQSVSLPPEGVVYVSTDQETVESFALVDALPDETWAIEVWAENAGTKFSEIVSITIPGVVQTDES